MHLQQQHSKMYLRGFEPGWPGKQWGWIELSFLLAVSICPYPFHAPPHSHHKVKTSGCFSLSIALCFNKQFAVTLCAGTEFELLLPRGDVLVGRGRPREGLLGRDDFGSYCLFGLVSLAFSLPGHLLKGVMSYEALPAHFDLPVSEMWLTVLRLCCRWDTGSGHPSPKYNLACSCSLNCSLSLHDGLATS